MNEQLIGIGVSLGLATAAFFLTDHFLPVDPSTPGASKLRKFWAFTLFLIFFILPYLLTLAIYNRLEYESLKEEIAKVKDHTTSTFLRLQSLDRHQPQGTDTQGIVNSLFWELQTRILAEPMPPTVSNLVNEVLGDIDKELKDGYLPIDQAYSVRYLQILLEGLPPSESHYHFTGSRILAGTNSGATSELFELHNESQIRTSHEYAFKEGAPVVWFFVYRSDVPLKVLYMGKEQTLADLAQDQSGGRCLDGSPLGGPEEGLEGYVRTVECIHNIYKVLWSGVINGDSCESVFRTVCERPCPSDVFIASYLETDKALMAERRLLEKTWTPKALVASRDEKVLKRANQLLVDAGKCMPVKVFSMPDAVVRTNFPRVLKVLDISADKESLAESIKDEFLEGINRPKRP